MVIDYLPVLLAFFVGAVYYFSNKWNVKHKPYAQKMVSFSAGVSITYILLELLPLFTEWALGTHRILLVSVLIGFISHHIIEKEIYQHNHKHELIRKLNYAENSFSFVYHIILGLVLVTLIEVNRVTGVLFFITISLFVFISTLPLNPHRSIQKSLFLASATLIGTIIATFLWDIPLWVETALYGLVGGVLLFTVIRHHIPFGRKGRAGYFALGFVLFSIAIIGTWYI
jgi:hypothetical protein